MKLLPHYFFIEFIKLIRSKYFLLIIIFFFSITFLLITDLHQSVLENFETYQFYFPKADFTDFYLTKLSSRLHLSIYLLAILMIAFSFELDIESKFLSLAIYRIPVNRGYYLFSKIMNCSVMAILAVAIVLSFLPSSISSYLSEHAILIKKDIKGSVFHYLIVQWMFILTLIALGCAYMAITRQKIVSNLVFFTLFYLGGLFIPYLGKIILFNHYTLAMIHLPTLFDLTISTFCIALFYLAAHFRIHKTSQKL